MSKLVFCPKCRKPAEAADYLGNTAVVSLLGSVLPTISCKCGYQGLPVNLPISEYNKLIKKSKKS
ncbi:Uncharacterised protein [Candidatus Bilamarchaeum dharawalense]|uniref:Uncharacterized protein n=1 Tax=Candidatus Bilamarchaeum dharawalense TaxID=2885759 RepID=A0A5E4LRS9_9ARCH|nr:Uncharacterised protein [Candidatus Bilamarchaeum dharawalense]